MNTIQKGCLLVGGLAIAATTFVVPYRVTGYDLHARLRHEADGVDRTVYAPLWRSPVDASSGALRLEYMTTGVVFGRAELNAGTLGIWWALIVLATSVSIGLTGETSQATKRR